MNSEEHLPGEEQAEHEAANEAGLPTDDPRVAMEEARHGELRARAELENFRKRMRREMDEERRYASFALVTDMLSVMDNLERAIASAEEHEPDSGLLQGVKMVSEQLSSVLAQHQCRPIEAEGKPFDPNVHEALAQQPSDEVPPGTVVHVHRSGYSMHDRVVRPAQVLVSSGGVAAEEPGSQTPE